MKKIIIVFCFTVAMFVANAQQNDSTYTGPAVAVKSNETVVAPAQPAELLSVKESEYNFGKIPQGKPVTHVFEITNISKDSLKIINVQASCGCTTPEWEKDKVLAPGGSSKITVGYNAAADGAFTKPVTITYNSNQQKVIFIKGEVWKTPATSAPENKSLDDLKN